MAEQKNINIIPSVECETMVDVRAGVDEIDRQLVKLLAVRFGYMRAAARIKPNREAVRDEPRKAQVKDNVRILASEAGLPDALSDQLWEILIESSIEYEFNAYDKGR
ncbi:chorismate mutase [Sphingorhabdus lutea]|uniref:chorismate mutase n=1 Tax=Sphingorhabdus lutea TaxID=1913578 RepID=A0A1L3JF27_9SPHN|nr:chorismate mutase [Sphingorhabdus lutea]APG63730.1 chorismate mutase [Sphingorhabdus lutea]